MRNASLPTTSWRQSIAWRLAVALGTVFVVIGIVSASCLWAIFDIHARLHSLKDDETRARSVVRLASAVRDQYAHVAHTIIIGNDSHASLFRDATGRLTSLAAEVSRQMGAGAITHVDRVLSSSREINELFESRVLPAVRAKDQATLTAQHERILTLAMAAQEEADALARRAEEAMEDLNQHVRVTQHGAILLTILAHVVALVTAVVVGIYLYRTIARPITALSAGTARVGRGDLDTEIAVEREDELGQLSHRFNQMIHAMKDHQKGLLHADRLVGLASMSAGIAHELNNPIGVIVGYAKLLRRRGETPDPKVLAAIEEEAERCQQVVQSLLQLTRGGTLQTSRVELRALVDDVVARVRAQGTPARLAFEVHGRASAEGDAAKLRQVLTNLLQNAVEACDTGGKVVVLIDQADTSSATVEVHDTGAGMSDEAREHVFEPFFTTKPAGSGLGLAISQAIARAHGGAITVVSTTPRGSIFRLTLPSSPEAST